MISADEIIAALNLQRHPREDGYFAESYRSAGRISWEALSARYEGDRCYSTAIYFLLKSGRFSEMHRLKSTEIYHYYMGAPATLLLLYPDGSGRVTTLGSNLTAGEVPQIVVPENTWQGAVTTGEYTLMGCTVSPGFEYTDYESGRRAELTARYPQFANWIERLTR